MNILSLTHLNLCKGRILVTQVLQLMKCLLIHDLNCHLTGTLLSTNKMKETIKSVWLQPFRVRWSMEYRS